MLQFWLSSYQTASLLIDLQKPSEILQEYVQRLFRHTTQIQQLTTTSGNNLVHITHFICNLHNQKLQHYMLGKNHTINQNVIMLAQKRDVE